MRCFLSLFLIIPLTFLSSCQNNSYEKKLLCDNLYGHYTAKADFVLTDKNESISGKINIERDENCRFEFTEPDTFFGISITGDTAGNSDTLCFEYAGIPASVPKILISRLSLMFSLFSDALPSRVSELSEDSFKPTSAPHSNSAGTSEAFANVSFPKKTLTTALLTTPKAVFLTS